MGRCKKCQRMCHQRAPHQSVRSMHFWKNHHFACRKRMASQWFVILNDPQRKPNLEREKKSLLRHCHFFHHITLYKLNLHTSSWYTECHQVLCTDIYGMWSDHRSSSHHYLNTLLISLPADFRFSTMRSIPENNLDVPERKIATTDCSGGVPYEFSCDSVCHSTFRLWMVRSSLRIDISKRIEPVDGKNWFCGKLESNEENSKFTCIS